MLYRYGKDEKGRPVKKAVIYTKEEHKIPAGKVDREAYDIVRHLKDCGFDAYIVGGAVRDLISGKTPKDFDIVTNATPSKIKRLFHNSRIIGRRFRLVHVFFGDKIYEVSTFRSICDGSVGNVFGTQDEDVQRRDFTINALYYDPIKEHVIDYVGGFKDILKKNLVPVIPVDRIFVEDPVRMLRAIKYSTSLGIRIPWLMRRRIRKTAHLLSPVSPSRLTEEFLKIVNSGRACEIIGSALETDVYMYLQPSATAMMYEDRKFEKSYMEHMAQLDSLIAEKGSELRLGQKLVYFVFDFIKSLTDWKAEVETNSATGELYVKTWSQVRNFVLPINPQRTELEYAIKESLKMLGVSVKIPKLKKKHGAVNSGEKN